MVKAHIDVGKPWIMPDARVAPGAIASVLSGSCIGLLFLCGAAW